jgi:malonyl-CoA decarboxylase
MAADDSRIAARDPDPGPAVVAPAAASTRATSRPADADPPTPARKAAARPARGDQTGERAAPRRNAKPPSDRAVRNLLAQCRRLLSERGDANGPAIAASICATIAALNDAQRTRFFDHLARDFNPDAKAVVDAAQAYAADPSPDALQRLVAAAEPPRQELFRRLNRAQGGTAAIVRLRRALLEKLPRHAHLQSVEADLLHLLSSWFNPGFLHMRRVDWNSPAQLLEQIIRHEAVHQIDGWDDLRRRLQRDRRCFAFFHPQLPDEPLIFVEVALVPEIAGAIAPLIDKKSQPLPPERFECAIFYSISNCQPGLRGVSLGNFLIKRVADEIKRELPQVKTFCTLSPIPGLMSWLRRGTDAATLLGMKPAMADRARRARATLETACKGDLSTLTHAPSLLALPHAAHQALWRLAAMYLVHVSPTPKGDPVARFHLDNGARLERLNANANHSAPGLEQSAGLMVNYLYDLARIEARHDQFVGGTVVYSRALSALL